MLRTLVILMAALAALSVPACYLLPTRSSAGHEVAAQAEASAATPPHLSATAGPDTATSALRWGGTILTLAGLAIVASRFLGFLTAPLIGGVLTVATGIATLTLADLMVQHWWIGPLILLALIALAVLEYLNDRDLLSRDPPWRTTPT